MSAGEFFDLVRPVFLIISALASIFVLANAQRNGFRSVSALTWALATFFLPLVTFPLYLMFRMRRDERDSRGPKTQGISTARFVCERFVLPFFYSAAIFALIALSQYREYNAVDAYLARAKQAKLRGDRELTIRQYKLALTLEDDAHTHKLLGIELNDRGELEAALGEFRLAERGGEPDPLLPFMIGALLDQVDQPNQARAEYKKFLSSKTCLISDADLRCEIARKRLNQ